MKKLIIAACLISSMVSCTSQTRDSGWINLFNGKDLNGWVVKIAGYPLGDNFAHTFRVKNGLLQVNYDGYGGLLKGRYGHIFYKKKFSAYLIVAEYRFYGKQLKDAPKWAYLNNGIMLFCQPPKTMALDQDYPISIECQLRGSDDTLKNHNGSVCTPGTNIMIDGKLITKHQTNSTSAYCPWNKWTHVEALVLGDSIIKHIVGTDTVMVYEHPTIGGGNVKNYDTAYKKDGRILKNGYIALQSESTPTEFREVKLFDLGPYMHDPEKLSAVIHRLQHRNDH